MITSKSNELIKHIKSLHQKKYRDEYKQYFVEGIKLVEEAISEGMPIDKIIICEELLNEKIDTKDYDVEFVNQNVFEYISDTKTPQGVMAIINIKLRNGAQCASLHQRRNVCTRKNYLCFR